MSEYTNNVHHIIECVHILTATLPHLGYQHVVLIWCLKYGRRVSSTAWRYSGINHRRSYSSLELRAVTVTVSDHLHHFASWSINALFTNWCSPQYFYSLSPIRRMRIIPGLLPTSKETGDSSFIPKHCQIRCWKRGAASMMKFRYLCTDFIGKN